jgi:hypothetical protein
MDITAFLDLVLIKYGTFFALALFAISYFVKRVYDYKTRKLEINHSLLQGKTLEAVNRFFENYNSAKAMWNGLSHNGVVNRELTPQQLDDIVQSPMTAVRLSLLELRLYLEPAIYAKFQGVENGLQNIYEVVGQIHGMLGQYRQLDPIARGNKFSFAKIDNFKANEKLISEACALIRDGFKS